MVDPSELAKKICDLMELTCLDPGVLVNFETASKIIYRKQNVQRAEQLDEEVYHEVLIRWQNVPWRVSL